MVLAIWLFLLLLICLDGLGKINIATKLTSAVTIFIASHCLILTDYYFKQGYGNGCYFALTLFFCYLLLRLTFKPLRLKGQKNNRLLIMLAGRRLIIVAWLSLLIQAIFYFVAVKKGIITAVGKFNFFTDMFIALIFTLGFFYNGCLRVILTSKWLSVIKRLAAFLFLPIPIINIFITYYLCHTAYYEYDYTIFKQEEREQKEAGDECRTKYPLVMIHGIGFRDFRFFNYWGRIPRELKRLGAKVYYGNQEALGTIEYNAADIKNKIFEVIKETGCEKVNIIAHSKGGLDARYAISALGMEDYVASLTTISTPHRGVKLVDYLCCLPDSFYKAVAKAFDAHFKRLGDKSPNFYSATRAFSTKESKSFNEKVLDSE